MAPRNPSSRVLCPGYYRPAIRRSGNLSNPLEMPRGVLLAVRSLSRTALAVGQPEGMLLVPGDPTGTYTWTATFSSSTQSITKSFTVSFNSQGTYTTTSALGAAPNLIAFGQTITFTGTETKEERIPTTSSMETGRPEQS